MDINDLTEEDMNDMKAKRSKEKMRVTTSATRLQKGIERRVENRLITQYSDELLSAYSDFELIDTSYSEAVGDESGKFSAFEIVNQMDTITYTNAVKKIFEDARKAHHEYKLHCTTETFTELNERLERLWTKIAKESSSIQISKDLERTKEILIQLPPMMEYRKVFVEADWTSLVQEIRRVLDDSETKEDSAECRMKSHISPNIATASVSSDLKPSCYYL